jgi:hypothetical protein
MKNQEYIKKEDVERVIFKMVEDREMVSDMKKIIKPLFALEYQEYKRCFMQSNFTSYTFPNDNNK